MLLFVYGTLMSELGLSSYMRNTIFIGKGVTKNNYSIHITGSIPCLHDDENIYQIEGELYKLNSQQLETIDFIETNGYWYTRKELVVIVNNIEYICQAYFNNDKGILLSHGSYRNYINSQ